MGNLGNSHNMIGTLKSLETGNYRGFRIWVSGSNNLLEPWEAFNKVIKDFLSGYDVT